MTKTHKINDRRGVLIDRYGDKLKPQASFGQFEGGVLDLSGDSDPISLYRGYDLGMTMSVWEWRKARDAGRYLFANVPVISGALEEILRYSFPLRCQYVGPDVEFGKFAEDCLYSWHRGDSFNVQGESFDFDSSCQLLTLGRIVDGDMTTVLSSNEDGSPAIQLLRAHRVGQRQGSVTSGIVKVYVSGGQFDGSLIMNGVIVNDFNRPIGFRLLEGYPEVERDVSARSVFMIFRAKYPDQFRGISELITVIKTAKDLKNWNEFELRAQLAQSQYAVQINNESGEVDVSDIISPNSTFNTDGTPAKTTSETHEAGLIKYFRAGTGSNISLLQPNRPGDSTQRWWEKVVKQAFYGLQWDADFALAISQPGGAYARTVIERCRKTVLLNQKCAVKWARKVNAYKLAYEIEQGNCKAPKDPNWALNWTFTGPAKLTADAGNEENSKREGYKLGTDTLLRLTAEKGEYWEEHRSQKEKETRDLLTRAQSIANDFGLTIQEALNLMEQRTPNGVPVTTEKPAEVEVKNDE